MFQEILKLYSLSLLSEPEQIFGGLLHKMWKVSTNKGQYALKELNENTLSKAGSKEEYELSERIANQFFKSGITAVNAELSINGQFIELLDNKYYILYKWHQGYTQKLNEINLEHSKSIGETLAKIHRLNIEIPEIRAPKNRYVPNENWEALNIKLESGKFEIKLGSLLKEIFPLESVIPDALNLLNSKSIVSHRDLDYKNVIWIDETPFLIDWEAAGRTNPTFEVINAAIDWSGNSLESESEIAFKELLKSYMKNYTIDLSEAKLALYLTLNTKLKWLEFNIKRSLGEITENQDEIELGKKESISTILNCEKFIAYIKTYTEWLEAIIK